MGSLNITYGTWQSLTVPHHKVTVFSLVRVQYWQRAIYSALTTTSRSCHNYYCTKIGICKQYYVLDDLMQIIKMDHHCAMIKMDYDDQDGAWWWIMMMDHGTAEGSNVQSSTWTLCPRYWQYIYDSPRDWADNTSSLVYSLDYLLCNPFWLGVPWQVKQPIGVTILEWHTIAWWDLSPSNYVTLYC